MQCCPRRAITTRSSGTALYNCSLPGSCLVKQIGEALPRIFLSTSEAEPLDIGSRVTAWEPVNQLFKVRVLGILCLVFPKPFAAIGGRRTKTVFDLRSQSLGIQALTDHNKLVFRLTFPLVVIHRKSLAAQVKNMPFGTFFKPHNPFRAKHVCWQLIV